METYINKSIPIEIIIKDSDRKVDLLIYKVIMS